MKDILIKDEDTLAMIYSIMGEDASDVKYAIHTMWNAYLETSKCERAEEVRCIKVKYIHNEHKVLEVI